MISAKARQLIQEALARAMFDCPNYIRQTMNNHGYTHSSAMEIARRMVRELDHAGWNPKEGNAEAVRELEDQIAFGLSFANCAKLCSESPEWSRSARVEATQGICSSLSMSKVVLVRRNARKTS